MSTSSVETSPDDNSPGGGSYAPRPQTGPQALKPELAAMGDNQAGAEAQRPVSSRSSDEATRGRKRGKRPPMANRKSSGTIIVPRDRSTGSDTDPAEYPPDDARAMSPRRNSEETEAMEETMRANLRENARQNQLNLLEIAESIELVRQSHDQLQRQNEMLQDYIGGLTRSMSRTSQSGKAGKAAKK